MAPTCAESSDSLASRALQIRTIGERCRLLGAIKKLGGGGPMSDGLGGMRMGAFGLTGTLNPKPYTLHPKPYTLHPKP